MEMKQDEAGSWMKAVFNITYCKPQRSSDVYKGLEYVIGMSSEHCSQFTPSIYQTTNENLKFPHCIVSIFYRREFVENS